MQLHILQQNGKLMGQKKKIFVATTIEGQILLGMICHFENSHETRCKTTVHRGLLEAIKMTNAFRKKQSSHRI